MMISKNMLKRRGDNTSTTLRKAKTEKPGKLEKNPRNVF